MSVSTAQARTKSAPWVLFPSRARHFPWKKMRWFLWHVQMHFNCARSHRVWDAILALTFLPANFRLKYFLRYVQVHFDVPGVGLQHFTYKFSLEMVFVRRPNAFQLRTFAQSVGPGLGIGPPPQHHHRQHHHFLPSLHHHSEHHHLPTPWPHHLQHHQPLPHLPQHQHYP